MKEYFKQFPFKLVCFSIQGDFFRSCCKGHPYESCVEKDLRAQIVHFRAGDRGIISSTQKRRAATNILVLGKYFLFIFLFLK